ncbi:MAG TPA: aldolase/citrate lyase family protein [Longimicrobiaceae bacterium]|jgi:citrate lyase beta subunit|nr:aldolase/citrate lyase family protein [Longimicrobiaceae bacterium]
MKTSLSAGLLDTLSRQVRIANLDLASRFPGESPRRQPVHVVYGGAQLFRSDSAPKIGAVARRTMEEYAPTPSALAGLLGLGASGGFAETLYERVAEKLRREPVEDFRIDFEDGYGNRTDAEEDGHAESVARAVAKGMDDGTLPPFIGIRIKTLSEELRGRAIRTLDIFVTTLLEATGGRLPDNFVVTLPKVTTPAQVTHLVEVLDEMEKATGLERGALQFEMMVETPQSIVDPQGRAALPILLEAARGRMVAAHFGTYDYTASVGITAAHQRMSHPACLFALHMMQVAFAGTGVWLSDGSTAVLPVAPHRAAEGAALTEEQERHNRESVHRAWKMHYDDVHHSLVNGFYQSWDLHPAQLVTRYAAVYAFFLGGLDAAAERLRNFVEKAAQATLVGDVFDDAATGQALLNFFLRGINCGALTEEETIARTTLTLDELRGRSFLKILRNRQVT